MNEELILQKMTLELIMSGYFDRDYCIDLCNWLEERHRLFSYDKEFCRKYCEGIE